MSIAPTYPGIYIEEIQSSAHTITAAPTNIAVFVGYSHPFKTLQPVFNSAAGTTQMQPSFNEAIECFSFSDYERAFGGFFTGSIFAPTGANNSPSPDNYFGSLPLAVNQFFLNGGTQCYVVGLQAKPGGNVLAAGTITVGGLTFTALEPTDANVTMSVLIVPKANASPANANADITISYGSGAATRVEVYRNVPIANVAQAIGTAAKPVSNLVTVVVAAGTTTFTATMAAGAPATAAPVPQSFHSTSAMTPLTIAGDFGPVFQQDSSLDQIPVFNMMVLPGVTSNIILSEALAFCETKRAFLIMDPPALAGIGDIGAFASAAPIAPNTALYFPYLNSADPVTGNPITLPPAPTVAGIYSATDLARGVWKAPAGLQTAILGSSGLTVNMSDARQGTFNVLGINCLRSFPNIGTVVFGARTSVGADANTAQQQWKYIPVRRMALFLEQTLYNNLGWVIFEPNDTPLWTAIKTSIEAFMLGLFRQQAFAGDTPSEAFLVKCDSQTTTQADVDNGIVNIVVAFAPLKPAEFVVIKLAQLAGQTSTS